MFDNIKAQWELRTAMFNSGESDIVTGIFDTVCDKHWISVDIGDYETRIKTKDIEVLFWSSNKYYGYASDGKAIIDGRSYRWDDERPSASAMLRMVRRIRAYILEGK